MVVKRSASSADFCEADRAEKTEMVASVTAAVKASVNIEMEMEMVLAKYLQIR